MKRGDTDGSFTSSRPGSKLFSRALPVLELFFPPSLAIAAGHPIRIVPLIVFPSHQKWLDKPRFQVGRLPFDC
jgi:hypothetical protein